MIEKAYEITLKNFLNCYYRESDNYNLKKLSDNQYLFQVSLSNSDDTIEIKVKVSAALRTPIWQLPCYVIKNNLKTPIETLEVIPLLIKELNTSKNNEYNFSDILQRISNSTDNLSTILTIRKDHDIYNKNSFLSNEQNLLIGHRQQPDPKSRVGFSKEEFIKYSPETNGKFQLHFMYVDKDILASESLIKETVDEMFLSLVNENDLPKKPNNDYKLFAAHPWQANYQDTLQEIKMYKHQKKIIDIGLIGPLFYPTTSVRTVYSPEADIMLKFSLNIAITNSVRINLAKECKRSLSAYHLSKGELGSVLKNKFPYFSLITDPAYIAIKTNDGIIDSSICIIRDAKFAPEEDIACIASLTEPDPFNNTTRIKSLIENLSKQKNVSHTNAANYWFDTYLNVTIAPVLWLYSEYGIALEAHQQNLLVKIEDNLPIESFYRDSQGYYYIKNNSKQKIFGDLSDLCSGTTEFVDHHFSYYFLVNQLISIIETITNTNYIEEKILVEKFIDFIKKFATQNQTDSRFCEKIINQNTLPLKANLLTRLHGLDELQAPLTNQSIYVKITNPFKDNHENI